MTTSNSAATPFITDLSIAQHSNAPSEPALIIDGVKVWSRSAAEGALVGTQTITVVNPDSIITTLNNAIPDTGS